VLDGVGGQLDERLGEALAVGQDGRLGQAGDPPAPRSQGPGLGQDLHGQVGHVHRSQGQEVRLLGLGEHDEVVDNAAHPVQLVGDQGGGVAAVRRVVAHQLQVAADDRDRGAQLVAGVVQEPPLGGEGRLQPVEHVVEGAGQLGDVVVAGDGDAAGQVRLTDPLGGLADQPDRGQHPPGHQPAGQAGHGQGAEPDQGEDADRVGDLLPLEVAELQHHQRGRPRVAGDPDRQDGVAHGPDRAVGPAVGRFPRGRHPGDEGRVGVEAGRGHPQAAMGGPPGDHAEERLVLGLRQGLLEVALQQRVHPAVPLAGTRVGRGRRERSQLVRLVRDLGVHPLVHPGQQHPPAQPDETARASPTSSSIQPTIRARALRLRGLTSAPSRSSP
jgi:hypothetical protein